MTHICVNKAGHHWFRYCLVAWPAPSHYLNQCWNIVNWTLGNKLQWNLNQSLHIFIHEKTLENVVRKMAAILSRPQCAKLRKARDHAPNLVIVDLQCCIVLFTKDCVRNISVDVVVLKVSIKGMSLLSVPWPVYNQRQTVQIPNRSRTEATFQMVCSQIDNSWI